MEGGTNLIVESTSGVEIIKELGVGFSSPEVHVGNLKVTPDLNHIEVSSYGYEEKAEDTQWHKLYVVPRSLLRKPIALSVATYSGCFVVKSP